MNLAQVARVLSGFVLFFSLIQASLLVIASMEDGVPAEIDPVGGFGWGAGSGLAIAVLLWLAGRHAKPDFFRREGLAVVGGAWLVAGVLGGIPYVVSGSMVSWCDAVFETISGLTTTGATILGSGGNPAIEDLPSSILLWRAMTQWIGGLGVIFVFIVLLPAMGVTGKNLLASEQVGVANDDLRPSMRLQARALFRLYVGMTAALGVFLWLYGKASGTHSGIDAICHAFTTLATGGFSTKNYSVGQFDSVVVELVTIVFMFLAGASFALLLSALRKRSPTSLWKNPEFRTYTLLTAGLIVGVSLVLRLGGAEISDPVTSTRDYGDYFRCLRDAAFQVVSIITSTGFGTADFQNWPKAALILLLLAMFIGGCSGSTAGGFKIVRILVFAKVVLFTIRHFIRPKSVEKIKVDDDVVPNSAISAMIGLFLLWIIVVVVGAIAYSFEEDIDLMSAFVISLSMCSCTGPAMSEVFQVTPGEFTLVGEVNVGPYGAFGDLHAYSKYLMSFEMILGRLELLAPLVLFAPTTWQR